MFKACSKCGKIHPVNVKCDVGRTYSGGQERKLRSSWDWQKKSLEIRDKAQHLCEVCRDNGRYTYENLEVHHIDKVKDNPDRLLDDMNLVCLCTEHHKEADSGKIKKDYLIHLAEIREERNSPHG